MTFRDPVILAVIWLDFMDDKTERPGLYNMWPSVTFINCSSCGTHWPSPSFGSKDAYFPPRESRDDRESLSRAYCPRCGVLMPSVDELQKQPHAIGLPPNLGKPFAGTIPKIRAFLKRSTGSDTQIWDYGVSHSVLTLKIDSKIDNKLAFIVCSLTKTVLIPNVYWKSSFELLPSEHENYWELRDDAANTLIVCSGIGIWYDLDNYS